MTATESEGIISILSFKEGFSNFRFAIDLHSIIDDQYRFCTVIGSGTEMAWRISVRAPDGTVALELTESEFPVFATYRLIICEANEGKTRWDVIGGRTFKVLDGDGGSDEEELAFIDAESIVGDQKNQSSGMTWNCDVLKQVVAEEGNEEIQDGENDCTGLTLHLILGIPKDYGEEEFREAAVAEERRVASSTTPHAGRTFGTLRSLFQQIDSPQCPLTDVTLVIVDSNFVTQRFYCHRLVLAAHSTVFWREFESDAPNSKIKKIPSPGGRTTWLYPIVDHQLNTVLAFVRYLYLGRVDRFVATEDDYESMTEDEQGQCDISADIPALIRLTRIAVQFGVDDLVADCENQLIRLSDQSCYRVAFARLAAMCQLRRLKTVLVSMMAGVHRYLVECAQLSILDDLAKETERKMFLPVQKLEPDKDEVGNEENFGKDYANENEHTGFWSE